MVGGTIGPSIGQLPLMLNFGVLWSLIASQVYNVYL